MSLLNRSEVIYYSEVIVRTPTLPIDVLKQSINMQPCWTNLS